MRDPEFAGDDVEVCGCPLSLSPAHCPRPVSIVPPVPTKSRPRHQRWTRTRNRLMIGRKAGKTGCPPLQRFWLVAPDHRSIFSCFSQLHVPCSILNGVILTAHTLVYSSNVKGLRTFWTSGSTSSSMKTSVARISRTFVNLAALSRKTGRNTGTMLAVVVQFMVPLSASIHKWLRSVAQRAPVNSLPSRIVRTSLLPTRRP